MPTDLAVLTDSDYSREKIELIKRTIAVGVTDDELQLFLYASKKTGLDPLTKQIYAIKRWNKAAGREVMTIQTGIDGYRLIADRTGRLAGISDPTYKEKEGAKNPDAATVTVRKLVGEKDMIAEFTATARWEEYVVTGTGGMMWTSKPYLMLGKCAEALALRKAFPADLSGVYTTEEMAQADNEAQKAEVFAEVERQKKSVSQVAKEHNFQPVDNDPMVGLPSAAIPPELDWHYTKASGVLICKSMGARKMTTKGGKGFVVVTLNGLIDNRNEAVYFHATHVDALLASEGKSMKLIVKETVTKAGKASTTIEAVMEIDGKKVGLEIDPKETEARLLASTMDWMEDDLRELHHNCQGNWDAILAELHRVKAMTEGTPVA